MIWQWNPNNSRVFVPSESVTVHGVDSLEAARKLMENFDPSKYQYIAQTKTGKPYNFENLEAAEAFAIKKSTKNSCCTVYHNGKPVVSYFNKKKMPEWKTVFVKKVNEYRISKKDFYYETQQGQGNKTGYMQINVKIETLPEKVKLTNTYMQYIKCKNGHLATKFTKDSITFHSNGNVYKFADGHICHTSASNIWLCLGDDIHETLVRELVKLRPELKQVLNDCPKWHIAGVFSRPTCYYCFDTFHKKAWKRNSNVYFGYFPREIIDESQIINIVSKRMGIPVTKSLKKVYNEHMMNMSVVHFLKNIGFKDTNSYTKLIGFGVHFCRHNPDKFAEFMKKFIELRGENRVVKMLSDSEFELVLDTAKTYSIIDEEIASAIIKDARNIEEIHETFNRQTTSSHRQLVDREIKYTSKEKVKFNYVCKDGITFELAKSSRDLAVVGMNMGICVGGYGDEAVSKRTTIIKMMKDDKYIACIEFKYGEIQQIKAKFNNPLQHQYKSDIDKWLAHGNIKCDCGDYYRIGSEWNSCCNYARINPNDFIPKHHDSILQMIKCEHTRCKHNNKWFTKDSYIEDRIEERYQYIDQHEPQFEAVEADELPF